MNGTVSISWGAYGGFYVHWGYTKRICLGWVALTYFPDDIDAYLNDYTNTTSEDGTSPSSATLESYTAPNGLSETVRGVLFVGGQAHGDRKPPTTLMRNGYGDLVVVGNRLVSTYRQVSDIAVIEEERVIRDKPEGAV